MYTLAGKNKNFQEPWPQPRAQTQSPVHSTVELRITQMYKYTGCYSTLGSVKRIVRDLPCRAPRERGGEEELRSTPQQIAIRLGFILSTQNKG